MNVVRKIGESPDEYKFPLAMDATHLNWPIDKYNERETVQVPAQITINHIQTLTKNYD